MTYKDKMVLTVLVEQRAKLRTLLKNEDNVLRYSNFAGACDAFDFAIALLRCPLGILIKEYNRIENGKSK